MSGGRGGRGGFALCGSFNERGVCSLQDNRGGVLKLCGVAYLKFL